jgi:hypothetical protein
LIKKIVPLITAAKVIDDQKTAARQVFRQPFGFFFIERPIADFANI